MSNCELVNLFHKTNICDRFSSDSGTVLLSSSSLKIFQALANSTVEGHNIHFKIVFSSPVFIDSGGKQNKALH